MRSAPIESRQFPPETFGRRYGKFFLDIRSARASAFLAGEMIPVFLASVVCPLFVIPGAEHPLHIAPFPAGTCAFCCPINLDRDVEYQLYTRRNPMIPQVLKFRNAASLRMSNFNPRVPTVFYIHGYSEGAPERSGSTIRDAYLRRGEYNMILVNWARLATLPWYVIAVKNTKVVGPYIARMAAWMDSVGAVPLSKMHVIGFSLGAEVAGFMGKALAPRKLGRITGLDAAYPLYMNTGAEGHLDRRDAMFVDVIHTDGGVLGFPTALGHADFYPNGGRPQQPGCNLLSVLRRHLTRLINQYIVCGHNRAWRFYAETVLNPFGFPGSRCPKWRPGIRAPCTWTPDALMGFAVDPRSRGMFYLRTNAESPFGRNITGYNIQ